MSATRSCLPQESTGRRIGPLVVTAVGVLLLAFTVTTEGEPGALPLAVTLTGVGWSVVERVRRRSRSG